MTNLRIAGLLLTLVGNVPCTKGVLAIAFNAVVVVGVLVLDELQPEIRRYRPT